jgi:hypothetical protein
MIMAMNQRTRAVIFLQFFIMVVLAVGLWTWDAGNQVFMSMPSFQQATLTEKETTQTSSHNVVVLPSAHWQRELVKRMEARGAWADALIVGRLNLIQTGEMFRDLDARSPTFDLENFRQHMPGGTDEEKYCRLVIEVVQSQLKSFKSPPDDFADEVVSKLEMDLDRLITTGELQFSAVSSQMPSLDSEPKRMTRVSPQPYMQTHEQGVKPATPYFTPGRR